MKTILLFLSFVSLTSFTQELNLGINSGVQIYNSNETGAIVGIPLEYRPSTWSKFVTFSLNTEPSIYFYSEPAVLKVPLFFKLIFGEKVRFSPIAGLSINSKKGFGSLVGGMFDIRIKKRSFLFLKGDYCIESYASHEPSKYGQPGTSHKLSKTIGITFGIKWNLLKQDEKTEPSALL